MPPQKYFYNKGREKTDSLSAEYFTIDSFLFNDPTLKWGTIKTFSMDGRIKSQIEYSDLEKRIIDGKLKFYYEDAKLEREINYKDKKLNGQLEEYYPGGKLKRRDFYSNGKFVYGNCFTIEGKDTAHFPLETGISYYIINSRLNPGKGEGVADANEVETLPVYHGGDEALKKFIANNLYYPRKAKENGISGTVYVSFVVDIYGNTIDHKVLRGVNPLLDEEALRVLKLLKFEKPAFLNSSPVQVEFTLPVRFVLL